MTTDVCTEDVIVQITSPQGNNLSPTNIPIRSVSSSNGSELGRKLLIAAKNGDTDTVLSLMAAGAPFSTDWLGTSALHLAAGGGHTNTAAVLLRAGSVRDARTKVERTPLHVAASGGHTDVVTLLLENGAAVDCRDMLGMTPLHWAAQRGHAATSAALLAGGADLAATDKFQHAPADLAARGGHARLAADLAAALVAASNKDQDPVIPEAKKAKPNPPGEGIKIKLEPGNNFTNSEQEAASGVGAALLARHGITLQPRDHNSTVLSALRCGRSLVLSDAGKLVLKESAAVETPTVTVQEPRPTPVTTPQKIFVTPTSNIIGDVQVKYIQIPKDTKIISPRKDVTIKNARPFLVNYNQLGSTNKKEGIRQPVKIIMNKTNFKKLMANTNASAVNLVETAQDAGSVSTGEDSAKLRAELAAARAAIARLTHELATARDQLANRNIS